MLAHLSATLSLADTTPHNLVALIKAAYPRDDFVLHSVCTFAADGTNGASVLRLGGADVTSTTGIALGPGQSYTMTEASANTLPLIEYWVLASAAPCKFTVDAF